MDFFAFSSPFLSRFGIISSGIFFCTTRYTTRNTAVALGFTNYHRWPTCESNMLMRLSVFSLGPWEEIFQRRECTEWPRPSTFDYAIPPQSRHYSYLTSAHGAPEKTSPLWVLYTYCSIKNNKTKQQAVILLWKALLILGPGELLAPHRVSVKLVFSWCLRLLGWEETGGGYAGTADRDVQALKMMGS